MVFDSVNEEEYFNLIKVNNNYNLINWMIKEVKFLLIRKRESGEYNLIVMMEK